MPCIVNLYSRVRHIVARYRLHYGMRRGCFVRSHVLRREIPQGVLPVEALPHEPAGGGEAMVGITPGVLEGRDGLSGNSGAMMHLYSAHPARTIPHPHELEHTLARLPILAKDLQ